MKRMNYTRPLAEVIELDVKDIITTSEFSTKLSDTEGMALSDDTLETYVNNGRIVLQ